MYTKRYDGRKADEPRKMEAKVGVVKRADGSAMFSFGKTVAIAAVYGPRVMHPQRLQDSKKCTLRCNYDMLSFSVSDRKRPGPSRRSTEISMVSSNALSPVIDLDKYPRNVIDVYIEIIEANAGTRTAGINAASLALAHAGLPMKDLVTSVSLGKVGGKIIVDITKKEEDYEEKGQKDSTDIPVAYLPSQDKFSLLQLDGNINKKELKEALETSKKVCKKIYEIQKKALKEALKE